MKGYGETWVNVYFPKSTMAQFAAKFKECTRWPVSGIGMNMDKGQGLVSIVGNMDNDNPPQFRTISIEYDEHGNASDNVIITDRGTIKKVAGTTTLQAIYKCTMFCSVGCNVMTPVGTNTCPVPDGGNYARVKFTILSMKAYNVAESVQSISLAGGKMKATLF